jgi:hypothetical protein
MIAVKCERDAMIFRTNKLSNKQNMQISYIVKDDSVVASLDVTNQRLQQSVIGNAIY